MSDVAKQMKQRAKDRKKRLGMDPIVHRVENQSMNDKGWEEFWPSLNPLRSDLYAKNDIPSTAMYQSR